MLTLAEASCFFDLTPVLDPTTSGVLFYAQLDLYDDAKRDSATAYRRVMSVQPGTTIPASRVISVLGRRWLVGTLETDGLATAHRDKYVLHPANDSVNVSRLPGFLSATVASTVWGDIEWVKDAKAEAVTSSLVPMYTAYLPSSTDVREYDVVWSGTLACIVEAVRHAPSGVTTALCRSLLEPVVTATLNTRTYDPVVGDYTASVPTPVSCLKLPREGLYLYDSQGSARNKEGDVTLVLPASTAVATKDTLTLGSAAWGVLSVQSVGGAKLVHGRRV